MKSTFPFVLAAALCFIVTACSVDDSGIIDDSTNADVVGSYKLTEWKSPESVDFDGDGVANDNMMYETNCYNSTVLTINADRSYKLTYGYATVDGKLACNSETTIGQWTRTRTTFTTTNVTSKGKVTTNFEVAENGQITLTRTMKDCVYPCLDVSGRQYTEKGTVTMIMTKE